VKERPFDDFGLYRQPTIFRVATEYSPLVAGVGIASLSSLFGSARLSNSARRALRSSNPALLFRVAMEVLMRMRMSAKCSVARMSMVVGNTNCVHMIVAMPSLVHHPSFKRSICPTTTSPEREGNEDTEGRDDDEQHDECKGLG
jgi:hypothetical protein